MKKILAILILVNLSINLNSLERSKYLSIKKIIEKIQIVDQESIDKFKNAGAIALLKSSNVDRSRFSKEYSSIIENFLNEKIKELIETSNSKMVICYNCQRQIISVDEHQIKVVNSIKNNQDLTELAAKNYTNNFLIWDVFIVDNEKRIGIDLQLIRAVDGALLWQAKDITETVIPSKTYRIYDLSFGIKPMLSPLQPQERFGETFEKINVLGQASFGTRQKILNDDRYSLNSYVTANFSNSVFNKNQIGLVELFAEANLSYTMVYYGVNRLNFITGPSVGMQIKRGVNARFRLGAEAEFRDFYIQAGFIGDFYPHTITIEQSDKGFLPQNNYSLGHNISFFMRLGIKIKI